MAKKFQNKYTFTPGTAGVGYVTMPNRILAENIVLITNVTRNVVIYNPFETTLGGVVTFNVADTTTFVNNLDGTTRITLVFDTSTHSSTDKLQIIVDAKEMVIRPWDFGTDAIERMRMAQPQSLIDADFEYGLQPTKWQNFATLRQYPGIYEIPGTDMTISSITTDGNNPSLISVTTVNPHGMAAGTPITLQAVNRAVSGYSATEGSFLIAATPAPGTYTFSFYARTTVGTLGQSLLTDATVLRRGGFYSGSALSVSTITSDGLNPSSITVTTNAPHGLVPGSPIVVDITSSGSGHEQAEGPFFVISQVINPSTFIYTARTGSPVSPSVTITANIYARADSFWLHRPFDGGVLLSPGGPTYGLQAVRMSKKYFRYQSGKGFFFNTGTVMRPVYDLQSATSTGTTIGSTITFTTDGVQHGFQAGAVITITGVTTSGYNGTYTVASVDTSTSFQVLATSTLGSTTATLDVAPKIYLTSWYGSAVRLGMFDDQNGIFWEYDGQTLNVCLRNSVIQLAGQVTVTVGSNVLTGTNSRFQDQLKVGDQIVVRGMTHEVTYINSQTSINISPDYRGTATVSGVRACLVKTLRIPQSQFNTDTIDGNGPSGFNIDPSKMQMLGIQYTWYGAGFVDFMVRSQEGKFITCHRIRNNNNNNEAYMRSGNLPARYSISNDTGITRLTSAIGLSDTSFVVEDGSKFPLTNGTVYIDNEILTYTTRTGNTFTGVTRAASHNNLFVGGAIRSFTAGAAATHAVGAGVLLLSITASPTLSHWGSAVIMDGNYDSDRGYIFNYAKTSISVTTTPQTVFMIRLAPSVSNAITGDLGVRDLLNRSQFLLTGIEVTAGALNPLVVTAILNPQNFPTTPASITWSGLTSAAFGGQPSLSQVSTNNPTWNSTLQYALPGEQVFSFIADGQGTKTLDLTSLKELTASPVGGTGCFPNGPDVLAINIATITGSATAQVLLRWSEAQA